MRRSLIVVGVLVSSALGAMAQTRQIPMPQQLSQLRGVFCDTPAQVSDFLDLHVGNRVSVQEAIGAINEKNNSSDACTAGVIAVTKQEVVGTRAVRTSKYQIYKLTVRDVLTPSGWRTLRQPVDWFCFRIVPPTPGIYI